MSYDYMLAKCDAVDGPEAFIEAAANQPVGLVHPLMAAISALFPAVQWEQSASHLGDETVTASWIGLKGPPEFHLLVDLENQVTLMSMSHCERHEVENVARELGLVALDEQAMEVFGG